MALRLIEIVLPEKDGAELRELLKAHELLEHRQIRLIDEEVLVRILLDAEQLEAVLDLLESRYTNKDGKRVVILPVEATLPRAEPEPTAEPEQAEPEENRPSGSPGRNCMKILKMPRTARGSIWPWWHCPRSWRPSACITTA